ncbi:MAG: glycosyltransferase family 39 protein [Victivallaceae bacterium]|nr:glycosyltransferase family 39 protein [Victivallaceae bacterium]
MRISRPSFSSFFRRFHTEIGRRPARAAAVFALAAAVLWIVQCAVFQNILALDVVEAISWGAQGVWGHTKHPPLSGWVAYAFSALSGRQDWGMYVAAQLCILTGLWYIYRLARCFFGETRAAICVISLFFVHYYNPSPMKFCTNFVEIALLPAASFYFYRALRENRLFCWGIFGVLSALAVLGKYSAACILGALFVLMLCRADDRKKLLSPGPYFALALFLVVLAPHIHWLAKHDFCCFRYVGDELENHHHSPWFFFEVLGATLYPFAVPALAIGVSLLPKLPRPVHPRFLREPFLWGFLLCFIPASPLLAMALCGKHVILMWLSSLAMWAPIAVVAVWPTALTRRDFRRLFYWTCIYTAVLWIALTVDVAVKPRLKLHLEPAVLIGEVETFKTSCGVEKFGAVIGSRWYANSVENYAEDHPSSADIRDEENVGRLLDAASGKAVLLIDGDSFSGIERFAGERFPGAKTAKKHVRVEYRSRWSRPRSTDLYFIVVPAEK